MQLRQAKRTTTKTTTIEVILVIEHSHLLVVVAVTSNILRSVDAMRRVCRSSGNAQSLYIAHTRPHTSAICDTPPSHCETYPDVFNGGVQSTTSGLADKQPCQWRSQGGSGGPGPLAKKRERKRKKNRKEKDKREKKEKKERKI